VGHELPEQSSALYVLNWVPNTWYCLGHKTNVIYNSGSSAKKCENHCDKAGVSNPQTTTTATFVNLTYTRKVLDGQDTWHTLNKLNITAFWVMRLCTDRNYAMFRTNLLRTVPNRVTNSSVL